METKQILDLKLPMAMLGTWSWGTGIVGGNTIFGNHLHEDDLRPVFDKAIENGLYAFDTAPVYGGGDAETILGTFIKEQDQIILSTKFMPFWLQPKSTMKKSLMHSLDRLQVDHIDIFWVHVPRNVKKWTTQLIPLMKAGKFKYAGVSNHNMEEILEAKRILEEAGLQLAAVQNHFSLLYQACNDNGILKWCHDHGVTFFSYMVLEQGALTSRYNKDNPFPKNTRRSKAFPIKTLTKIEPLLSLLKEIACKYGVDVAEIATAYAINKGTTPIIGVTKTHHIDSIVKASKIILLNEEITALESMAKMIHISKKGFWEKNM